MTIKLVSFCIISMMIALAAMNPARCDEVSIPYFWDSRERLPEPDLSSIKRMRFLTTTDFPPFNYVDKDGHLSGLHIDLARAVCDELKIADKCQIQAMPYAELEGALAKGDGEAIISGFALTPETRSKYAFTRSYFRFPARFMILQGSALAEPSVRTLRGKRVGVVTGSAHERLLHDLFPEISVIAYATSEAMIADLQTSKIDAMFGDGMRLALWLARPASADCCKFLGGPYLAPDYLGNGLAIATTLENAPYAAAFDAALQQISAKGVFAELYLRYFPISFY